MWDVQCEEGFWELKKKLRTTPVLIFPGVKKPFMVNRDASKMGLGGMLMKNGQVVAYASQKLKIHEELSYPEFRVGSCSVC